MIEHMRREWKSLWTRELYLRGEPEYLFLLHVLVHLDRLRPDPWARPHPPTPPTL